MPARPTSARRTLATVFAVLAAVALGFWLAPGPRTSAQTPGPGLALDKIVAPTSLAGRDIDFELVTTNSGNAVEYNVSLSDLLPQDTAYVPGSTSPASAGEPATSVDPATGRQVLVWSNVRDLQPGESFSVTFRVSVDEPDTVVGLDLVNTAYAAAQTDPRFVPDFGPDGSPVPGSFSESATDTAVTTVSALAIEKSTSNSPEGELLRGVHDQRALTTLTIDNSEVAATDDVVVVDHLPAAYEFLGCGDVDNTLPESAVEYPGAPRLGSPPFGAPGSCIEPVTVETVTNPPPANGVVFPPGVYTKVTWQIGSIPAGGSAEVSYVVGIPLRANTTTWPDGEPSAGSGEQAANLGNNSGASSRELAAESSVTNYAAATGDYSGNTLTGADVAATTTETRVVEDVRMRKSVAPEVFSSSGIARFSIVIDASEYVAASGIVVTDVLPDGYCPLSPGDNFAPGSPADCGSGGDAPSTTFESVTYDPTTGGYTIVFEPIEGIDPNGTVTITFDARMRDVYTGGARAGRPTLAGDTFTNRVSLSAVTTPIAGTGETGSVTVGDVSSATQTTPAPSVDKTLKPRYFPMDCDPTAGQPYGEPSGFTPAQLTFRKGDLMCFKLRVTFPSDVHARDVVVTDFLPPGTEYVTGSAATTADNTVTVASVTESSTTVTWTIGDEVDGNRYVDPGAVFEVTIAADVIEPASPPLPDLLGNLQKVRYADTEGSLFALRDSVDFAIAPAANLALEKGVYSVDAPAAGPNPADTDGLAVQQGSTATYRIDIENLGRSGFPGAEFSVRGVQTWDVLPSGVACADVGDFAVVTHGTVPPANPLVPTALDPSFVDCTDPGDPGHPDVDPSYGDSATQSILRWTFPSPDLAEEFSIFVGETMTLLYDVTFPSEISVSTRFDNAAGVRSFESFTDRLNETATYFPADNIDADVPAAAEDAAAADDTSFVVTANAVVTKSSTTSVDEVNNNLVNQATIGETVNWTVGVVVPARTTVYEAVLTDPMPTGITFLGATAGFSPTGTSPATDPLPGGVLLDPANGSLTFPAIYDNATDEAQRFEVVITSRVSTIAGNSNGTNRTNTATFASKTSVGGSSLPPRTAATTVRIVEPSPTLLKSASPVDVIGGQTVTFQITARNASGRPPMHDSVVTDCIPAGVTFAAVTANNAGAVATEPGDGTNGCASGTTKLSWTIGSLQPATANQKILRYTGIVDPTAVGGSTYTNEASLRGTSIDDSDPTPTGTERTYTRNAEATVTVVGQNVTKGVLPTEATIGETVTYTVVARIPASTTFYESTLVDTLPNGLDPAAPNFSTVSVSCTDVVTSADCAGDLDPAFGTPLVTSGQTVAWYVGDIAPSPDERLITVVYSTVVLDVPSNSAGATLTNSAGPRWSDDPAEPTPTTADEAAELPQGGGVSTTDVTVVEPDLGIAKSVSDAAPAPGSTFTYEVTVTNATGPTASEAFEVSATDDVPAGVVVDPASISDGGILSGAGPSGNGTITWSGLGDLEPGESKTLSYAATLAPSALIGSTPLTNTARVAQYFSLPPGAPDRREYDGPQDTATVTPVFPDAGIEKSAPDGPIARLGVPFTWQLDVTNLSTTDGFDVDVTDILPPNWTYDVGSAVVTVPVPGGSPTAVEPTVNTVGVQQTLDWVDIGDLPGGAVARITFTATPTAAVVDDPGVGVANPSLNFARAVIEDATGADGNAEGSYSRGFDSADAVIPSADLRMVKTATPTEIAVGADAVFTVTVTNDGPDAAVGPFTVTDAVFPGLTLTDATGSGWTCVIAGGGGSLTCTNPTASLAVGASLPTITVTASTPAAAPGGTTYRNLATVTAESYDPDPDNDSDTAEVTVLENADLELTKTTASTVVAGEDVSYVIAVRNNGPDTSIGSAGTPITVTDTLPAGLTYVTAGGTGWTCDAVGQVVTCELASDIDADTNAPTITVVATLDPSASGDIVNTAVVVPGDTLDPDPSNNTDEVTDTVDTSADLAIVKSHTAEVAFGDTFAFTLAVTNNGPSDAQNVSVTDTLPAGLTYVSGTGTGWTCNAVGQAVTCDLTGPLAAEAATTITLNVTAGAAAVPSVTNTATVTTTTPDPDPDNDTDDDTVDVAALVDLAITKTHTGDAVIGSELTFTLAVTNNGPTVDPGPVTVTDTLPTGLTYVTAVGSGWSCSAEGQDVTCTRATGLGIAEESTISLITQIATTASGTLTNTATVTSAAEDTDPGNNTDSDELTLTSEVKLNTRKTGAANASGTQINWTISVTNAGPSPTTGATTVTDTLPAGVTFVSGTGVGWTCTGGGQVVTCTNQGVLTVGTTSTVTVLTNVAARPGQNIVNAVVTTTANQVEGDNQKPCAPGQLSCGSGSVTIAAVPDGSGNLPRTGADVLRLALSALVLLTAGLGLAVPARRRRRRHGQHDV